MAKCINGLYFYRLSSAHTYSDDVTLNTALNISHIDHNFKTLKDNDIKSVDFDKETKEIVLTKNNNQVESKLSTSGFSEYISSIVSGDVKDFNVEYSKEDGVIEISWTKEDGTHTITIDGLMTVDNMETKFLSQVNTDITIDGNGTLSNPLRINSLYETGRYKPCISYVDVLNGEEIPTEDRGDRYLIRDRKNLYGRLYPLSSVQEINDILSDGWHVATKEDFDEIISELDKCGDLDASQVGKQLKSRTRWNTRNGEDLQGFCGYPTGYYRIDSIREYGEYGSYWTLSVEGAVENVTFLMDLNNDVSFTTDGNYEKHSIRLAKKYNGKNYNPYEEILGEYYRCILIGDVIITTKNLSYETEDSIDNEYGYVEGFYIVEYDGKKWNSNEFEDGYEVLLKEGINGETYRYVRVVEGSLVTENEVISEKASEIVAPILADLNILTDNVSMLDKKITEIYESVNSRVNDVEAKATGQYKPCKKRVTILPNMSTLSIGDRYLLETNVNLYGNLYDYVGMMEINQRVSSFGWRVPTDSDLDDLAASIPSPTCMYNIKSSEYWNGTNFNKFNLLPSGYINVDYSDKLIGQGETTFLWSQDEDGHAYGIASDTENLSEDRVDKDDFYAVRICKDFDGFNFKKSEIIDGVVYDCTLMPSHNSPSQYRIWATRNANYIVSRGHYKNLEQFIPPTKYYMICEWNGFGWINVRLEEGESVVLFQGINGEDYMEYMLWHGNLISIVDKYVKNKKPGDDYNLYYGTSEYTELTDAKDVKKLNVYVNSSRSLEPQMLNCEGGRYIYYCVPSILTDASIEFYANGILFNAYMTSFLQVDGIDYTIYRLTNQYHGRIKLEII